MRAKKQRELVRRITRSEKLAQRLIGSWWIEALLTTDMIRRAPPRKNPGLGFSLTGIYLMPDTSCDLGAFVRQGCPVKAELKSFTSVGECNYHKQITQGCKRQLKKKKPSWRQQNTGLVRQNHPYQKRKRRVGTRCFDVLWL